MGVSTPHARGTAALARARARLHLVPDTVETVEPARGELFVVVRTLPDGDVVVLDGAGRLVRGRARLASIESHRQAARLVERVLAEAAVERRLDHTTRSTALLTRARTRLGASGAFADALLDSLARLEAALTELADAERRLAERPPTVRTLRRTAVLVNAAAAADRDVLRAGRAAAADLPRQASGKRAEALETVRCWLVARFASPDLRFFIPELEDPGLAGCAEAFAEPSRR